MNQNLPYNNVFLNYWYDFSIFQIFIVSKNVILVTDSY